jgi:hypothetical protein
MIIPSCPDTRCLPLSIIPAKAGIHRSVARSRIAIPQYCPGNRRAFTLIYLPAARWIPAFAGMTRRAPTPAATSRNLEAMR